MPPTPDFLQRANAAYIEDRHQRYLRDPSSVPPDWAAFFAGADLAAPEGAAGAPAPAEGPGGRSGGIFGLVQHYRVQGHLGARLDPLGGAPEGSPLLDPVQLGFGESDLARAVADAPLAGGFQGTLRDLIEALRATYCGSIGVEYMGIADAGRREWLQERMEPHRNRPVLAPEERRRILRQIVAADGFEEFLQVRFPGQKRFSLEGASALIPMLDALAEEAAGLGVVQLVIGMPHRGRINVLANLMEKPLEAVFSEFESGFMPEDVQGEGDVKYHLGYSCDRRTRAGRDLHLDLNFNPSHLEFVNPVVLGAVRARQDVSGDTARARGVAVLIHGDASFAGEGIVPETLAMAALPHYETGGTIHIVVNNQIGFTTAPADARASRYATDIARVENDPVFHVNADDPEAVVHVIRLAVAYRMRFKRDVFVDLVCYRKHGHNELDDPAFTQPVMVRAIARHPSLSTLYAGRLVREGVLDEDAVAAMRAEATAAFQAAHGRVRAHPEPARPVPLGGAWVGLEWAGEEWEVATAVP
ncbi:MAG TPA: thiamine pyrophosphate-dependent enzyme, partial [Candidatus Eisenbacteria bacterium]